MRHEKSVNEKLRRQRLAAELTTMTNLSHVEEERELILRERKMRHLDKGK